MSTVTENYLSKLERAFLFHKQHSVLQKIHLWPCLALKSVTQKEPTNVKRNKKKKQKEEINWSQDIYEGVLISP
jgi:hypothetical protein